jgi:hypothetical protein
LTASFFKFAFVEPVKKPIMLSKFAINIPKPTTNAPTPVLINAARNNFNATLAPVVAAVVATVAVPCATVASCV